MLLSDPPICRLDVGWGFRSCYDIRESIGPEPECTISSSEGVRCGELRTKLRKVRFANYERSPACITGGEMLLQMPKTVDLLTGWDSLELLRICGSERKKRCIIAGTEP